MRSHLLFAVPCTLLLTTVIPLGGCGLDSSSEIGKPNGKGGGVLPVTPIDIDKPNNPSIISSQGISQTNGIQYHNGPVMRGTVNVYYIWYGDWAGNTAIPILTELAQNIGGSPYFGINATYSDTTGSVTGSVHYVSSITDTYSHGRALSDADIQAIVSNAIVNGRLPSDENAVYFVLTSSDVNNTEGFCINHCGWHNHGVINGLDIKYSFVGNAERCPNTCAAQQNASPNGNIGADAMASVVAHELEETITDPDLNAWFDSNGNENADKCAWTFGNEYIAANGSMANQHIGSRDYLIQQNWINAGGGYCSIDRASIPDWGYADRRWLVDVNGDGRTDYCRAVGTEMGANSYLGCSIATNSGILGALDWSSSFADWGYPDRRWMADLNGDGKADYCRAVGTDSGAGSYLRCSLSSGTSISSSNDILSPIPDWGYPDRRWMADA